MNSISLKALGLLALVMLVSCKKNNPVAAIQDEAKAKRDKLKIYKFEEVASFDAGSNPLTRKYITYIKKLPDGHLLERRDTVKTVKQLPMPPVKIVCSPLVQSGSVIETTESDIQPELKATEKTITEISDIETPDADYYIVGMTAIKKAPMDERRKKEDERRKKQALEVEKIGNNADIKPIYTITNSIINGYSCNVIHYKYTDEMIMAVKGIIAGDSFKSYILKTSKDFSTNLTKSGSEEYYKNIIKSVPDYMTAEGWWVYDQKTGLNIQNIAINSNGKVIYSNSISNIQTNIALPDDFFNLPANIKVIEEKKALLP